MYKMAGYPARLVKEENGQYSVLFLSPGLEGCVTYGNDLEEARLNAQEALDLYLETMYSARECIPFPHLAEGEDICYFEPEVNVSIFE